jgi:hypothetical protein
MQDLKYNYAVLNKRELRVEPIMGDDKAFARKACGSFHAGNITVNGDEKIDVTIVRERRGKKHGDLFRSQKRLIFRSKHKGAKLL